MRIERSEVSSKAVIKFGMITGYVRNVASFNSHQSAYTFYVIYLYKLKLLKTVNYTRIYVCKVKATNMYEMIY